MKICKSASYLIEKYVKSHTDAMVTEYQNYMENKTERDWRFWMERFTDEDWMVERNYQVSLCEEASKHFLDDSVSIRNRIQLKHFNNLINDLKKLHLIPVEI